MMETTFVDVSYHSRWEYTKALPANVHNMSIDVELSNLDFAYISVSIPLELVEHHHHLTATVSAMTTEITFVFISPPGNLADNFLAIRVNHICRCALWRSAWKCPSSYTNANYLWGNVAHDQSKGSNVTSSRENFFTCIEVGICYWQHGFTWIHKVAAAHCCRVPIHHTWGKIAELPT